ncbi:MAG: GntR family transcriptional regulator [Clostridiaceae bacterium]
MLDRNSPVPLYAQLEDVLRAGILNHEWEVNTPIPSEVELSKIHNLSRMTVRSVITRLVNEGLLYRVQGKGTFVSEPKIATRSLAYMGIREQLEMMGYETTTQLVSFDVIRADAYLSGLFTIQPGEPIQYIERVRSVNDDPISIHRSYIPQKLCPSLTDENLETEQLCVIMERQYGLKADKVSESLSAILASEREAEMMLVEPRCPLLMLEDINKTSAGVVFEYSKVLFRGDKIKLHFEF